MKMKKMLANVQRKEQLRNRIANEYLTIKAYCFFITQLYPAFKREIKKEPNKKLYAVKCTCTKNNVWIENIDRVGRGNAKGAIRMAVQMAKRFGMHAESNGQRYRYCLDDGCADDPYEDYTFFVDLGEKG